MLSMYTKIKDLAWFTLNTRPAGKKMTEKRLITAAMTEVVDGKFVVGFLPGTPVVPLAPEEKSGCVVINYDYIGINIIK